MLLVQANPPPQQGQYYLSDLYSANGFIAFHTAVQTVWLILIYICDLAFDFAAFWIFLRSTWLLTYPGTTRDLGTTRERELFPHTHSSMMFFKYLMLVIFRGVPYALYIHWLQAKSLALGLG